MQRDRRRLARVVQETLGSSFSRARREVEVGHVLVNGVVTFNAGCWVSPTDAVLHRPNLPRRTAPARTPPIEVLFLDGDVVVVNKPSGLLTHPTLDKEEDTVVSRTAAAAERRSGRSRRVHIVHRLDRDTSGVMVLALTHVAAESLQRQFRSHSVERRYLALVRGVLAREVVVARSIGRPRAGARRAALAPGTGGRPAHTVLRPSEPLGPVTLVEAELGTGRTHQVRVHLSYLHHPVLGDPVYGEPKSDPVEVLRLALHAAHLSFVHPGTGQRLTFTAPLPPDLAHVVTRLRVRPGPRARPQPAVAPDRARSEAAKPPPLPRTQRRPARAHGSGSAAPRPRRRSARPRPAR
jgi:23S rRNA pseudouridine1911/1915/1917 synthase